MDWAIVALGIIGSLASVVSIYFSAPDPKAKIFHTIYMCIIIVLVLVFAVRNEQSNTYERIENQASRLVETANLKSDGGRRGFILATLSFLEKYKQQFPETFIAAQKLVENSGILVSKQENGLDRLYQSWSLGDVSEAMAGLVKGISVSR